MTVEIIVGNHERHDVGLDGNLRGYQHVFSPAVGWVGQKILGD